MKLALRVCLGTLASSLGLIVCAQTSSKAKYGISGSMWSYTGVAGNFGGEPMYLFMIRTPNSPARRLKKIRGVINPRSHQLTTANDLHGEAKKEAKPGEAKKEKTSEFLR
jgi:hypothetical protein